MSGGSRGGSTQTVEKQNIPDEYRPMAEMYRDNTMNLARKDIPYYQGPRTAPLNPWQTTALEMTAQRATQGSPVTNAAQGEAVRTIGGGYLSTDGGVNPYMGSTVGANPNAGQNPYLENAVQSAQNDVVRNYQTGVAPQLDRAAAQANAFGNSGYGEATRNNQYALGQNLANISTGMRMQDYGNQQQLAESGLNRQMGLLGMNSGMAENSLNRGLSLYQGERGNQMRGLLFAPQLAAADYQDAQALGQSGDIMRQFQQEGMDEQMQRWAEQAYMPYTRNDLLAQALGVGSGLGSSQQAFSPSTRNPIVGAGAGALGGALMGSYLGGAGGAAGGAASGAAMTPYAPYIGAALGGLLGYYM